MPRLAAFVGAAAGRFAGSATGSPTTGARCRSTRGAGSSRSPCSRSRSWSSSLALVPEPAVSVPRWRLLRARRRRGEPRPGRRARLRPRRTSTPTRAVRGRGRRRRAAARCSADSCSGGRCACCRARRSATAAFERRGPALARRRGGARRASSARPARRARSRCSRSTTPTARPTSRQGVAEGSRRDQRVPRGRGDRATARASRRRRPRASWSSATTNAVRERDRRRRGAGRLDRVGPAIRAGAARRAARAPASSTPISPPDGVRAAGRALRRPARHRSGPLLEPRGERGRRGGAEATERRARARRCAATSTRIGPRDRPGFFAAFPPFDPELPERLARRRLAYVGNRRSADAGVKALLDQAARAAPAIAAGVRGPVKQLGAADEAKTERELLDALGDEAAFALVPGRRPTIRRSAPPSRRCRYRVRRRRRRRGAGQRAPSPRFRGPVADALGARADAGAGVRRRPRSGASRRRACGSRPRST